MICPHDRRVVLDTFMLEREAERWWQTQHKEKFYMTPLTQIIWEGNQRLVHSTINQASLAGQIL